MADCPVLPEVAEAERAGRVLLVRPRSSRGLRPEHLVEIEAFARAG